jgi:hypothetical protein
MPLPRSTRLVRTSDQARVERYRAASGQVRQRLNSNSKDWLPEP